MALAGIWEAWRGEGGEVIRSFAVITTEANQLMSQVHNRMPVILEEADWPVWLGERGIQWRFFVLHKHMHCGSGR